jgi:hypothetical protein
MAMLPEFGCFRAQHVVARAHEKPGASTSGGVRRLNELKVVTDIDRYLEATNIEHRTFIAGLEYLPFATDKVILSISRDDLSLRNRDGCIVEFTRILLNQPEDDNRVQVLDAGEYASELRGFELERRAHDML